MVSATAKRLAFEAFSGQELTPAQIKLLARLPDYFTREEDFRSSNTPPTIVRSESGAELFRFGRGDARAFGSLVEKGAIVRLDTTRVAGSETAPFLRHSYGRSA